jgi:hypothetical protein
VQDPLQRERPRYRADETPGVFSDDVDEIVVERLVAGEVVIDPVTIAERRAAVLLMYRKRRPVLDIAIAVGAHPRQVQRDISAAS